MALTANGRVAPDTGYRYCNTDYAYEAWAAEPARSSQVDLQLGRIRRWGREEPPSRSGGRVLGGSARTLSSIRAAGAVPHRV